MYAGLFQSGISRRNGVPKGFRERWEHEICWGCCVGVDAMSLGFRFKLLDGAREQNVLNQVKAGALCFCSIAYTYNRQKDVQYRGGALVLTRVDLHEISLTNTPAWYGTSIRAVPA
jgi:HK97 family phage prohead protease